MCLGLPDRAGLRMHDAPASASCPSIGHGSSGSVLLTAQTTNLARQRFLLPRSEGMVALGEGHLDAALLITSGSDAKSRQQILDLRIADLVDDEKGDLVHLVSISGSESNRTWHARGRLVCFAWITKLGSFINNINQGSKLFIEISLNL